MRGPPPIFVKVIRLSLLFANLSGLLTTPVVSNRKESKLKKERKKSKFTPFKLGRFSKYMYRVSKTLLLLFFEGWGFPRFRWPRTLNQASGSCGSS